jgi:hypothetical protein
MGVHEEQTMPKSTTSHRWMAAFATCVVLLWSGAAAAVPMTVTHQGRLLNEEGEPMTGQVRLQFALHTSKTEDAMVWNSKPIEKDLGDGGFYSVVLGQNNPIDSETLKGEKLWIQLTITNDGNTKTLSPRIQLHSVPYAVRAGMAESVAEGAVGNKQISGVAWKKIDNVPKGLSDGDDDAIGDLSCKSEQLVVYDGQSWTCRSAGNFARADQACNGDRIVTGIDPQGNVECAPDSDTTYSAGGGLKLNGQKFQLQGQSCPSGRVAVGINGNGSLKCARDRDTNTTYAKNCGSGKVVGGLTANGDVVCVNDANDSYSAGSGLKQSGSTFALASMNCPSGEVARAIQGGSLTCTSHVEDVNAGQGLNGGGSGRVGLSVDYDDVQERVTGDCSGGEFVVAINKDGSVQCGSERGGGRGRGMSEPLQGQKLPGQRQRRGQLFRGSTRFVLRVRRRPWM